MQPGDISLNSGMTIRCRVSDWRPRCQDFYARPGDGASKADRAERHALGPVEDNFRLLRYM